MQDYMKTSVQNSNFEKQLRQNIKQQDVYRAFLLNANSVAPQQNRAFLLKSRNPVSSFIISTADVGKDIVELGKALVTGKSNDNQLGRFNDLGMKLGSLGIASYLFTRRGTGTKGIMEFLGAGAFFASMAAWPRLLISLPLKLRFGFDIRQQYIDAQGRKKRLYLDNQFVPDLYSQEQIDKVAKKMGISKSNPEYRELVKEKMRAIALQGNTLWMLSAGFSPLLTSLICNVAEKGVTKYIVNSNYNKVVKNIDNIENIARSRQLDNSINPGGFKEFKALIDRLTTEPDEAFYRQAANLMDPFSVFRSVKDVDDANLVAELSSSANKIANLLKENYNLLKTQNSAGNLINVDNIIPILKENASQGMTDLQGNTEFGEFVDDILNQVLSLKNKKQGRAFIGTDDLKQLFKNGLQNIADNDDAKRLVALFDECASMQEAPKEVIQNFAKALENAYVTQTRPIGAKVLVYGDFLNSLAGQKYESLHTSIHLNSVNNLMDLLHIPYKDLKVARNSVESARNILQNRLVEISSDDINYGKFISSLTAKQSKFEAEKVDNLLNVIKNKLSKGLADSFASIPDNSPLAVLKSQMPVIDETDLRKLIEEKFGVSYDAFVNIKGDKKLSVDEIISLLEAKGAKVDTLRRSTLLSRVVNMFVDDKGAGIRATGHRYILAADFERRLQTGELKEYWKLISGNDEISDEVLKACRSVIYDGSMNDLANKFYMNFNGDLATKILKLIFGDPNAQGVDAMRAGLSKLTYEKSDPALLQKLCESRRNFYKIYAQMSDFARPGHKISGVGTDALQKVQYSMLGKPASELFMDTASKMFNDKTWMRMFGGLFAAVVGVVLISQCFFGKVRNEHLYGKKNENGGVNVK